MLAKEAPWHNEEAPRGRRWAAGGNRSPSAGAVERPGSSSRPGSSRAWATVSPSTIRLLSKAGGGLEQILYRSDQMRQVFLTLPGRSWRRLWVCFGEKNL